MKIITLNLHLWQEKNQLEEIIFETTVTTVGDYSFANCESISTITWNNIETIGSHSFEGCSGIKKVTTYLNNTSLINLFPYVIINQISMRFCIKTF